VRENSSFWGRRRGDHERMLGGCTAGDEGGQGVRMPIIPWGRLACCPGCVQATPAEWRLPCDLNVCWGGMHWAGGETTSADPTIFDAGPIID